VNTVPGNGVLSGSFRIAMVRDLMDQPKQASIRRLAAEADAGHQGIRLDRLLAERLPELSRTRLQSLIKEGRVSLPARRASSA
jgi:23S rRNA-/tRNA-specific pseudouridylate synthase